MKHVQIVLFAVFAMFIGTAQAADAYLTAGLGGSSAGNTFSIGAGKQINDVVTAEVNYRNFGTATNSATAFVGTIDPATGLCTGTCAPVTTTIKDKLSGVDASIKFKLCDWAYSRMGAMYHKSNESGFTPLMSLGITAYGLSLEASYFGNVIQAPDGKKPLESVMLSYKYSL